MECPACHTETFVCDIDQNCRVLNICQNKDCGTKFPNPEELALPAPAPKAVAALAPTPKAPTPALQIAPRAAMPIPPLESMSIESHVKATEARAKAIEAFLESVEPLRVELAGLQRMLAAAKKIPRRRRRRMVAVPTPNANDKVA